MKRAYHTFKRTLPGSEPNDPPWILRALAKPGTAITEIFLTEQHIIDAIEQRGFADGQNCAGAFCVNKHRQKFSHPTMPLVDWWYNRVYICESINRRTGKGICRVYAHYDSVAELFDGNKEDLEKLLKRVRKTGSIKITLYPVTRGTNPLTGKPTKPGESGTSGEHRYVGNELRILSHMRAFGEIVTK